jgi:hypothetical protein
MSGKSSSNSKIKEIGKSNNRLKTDETVLDSLGNLNKQIRSIIPRKDWSEINLSSMPSCLEKTGRLNDKQVRRLIMVLTPRGCEYCLRTGGCLMCGEVTGSTLGTPIPAKYHISQFIQEYTLRKAWDIPWVCLYNEGNLLNDEEVSSIARRVIFGTLIANGHERITIEARPEYIKPHVLTELKAMELELEHYESVFEVGIGLEAVDDDVREYCVNKGFGKVEYEQAIKLLKSFGMRVLTYILVKPPFLTEKEAIDEAIRTAKYAFKAGSDVVSFELSSIHGYTVVEYLGDLYRPPWLWSAIEIAKAVHGLGEIRIGGEPGTYYPKSSKSAYNCERCTEDFWKAIKQYESTADIATLNDLDCQCREKWKKELNQDNPRPIKERIASAMHKLSFESYAKLKSEKPISEEENLV